jgi:hypothetical protein
MLLPLVQVTDRAAKHLLQLHDLQQLQVEGTGVSPQLLAKLKSRGLLLCCNNVAGVDCIMIRP